MEAGKWYKCPEGLFYIISQNETHSTSINSLLFLTEWIIDGEYIVTDGIYRSLPKEGIEEATPQELWRAMKLVNENLVRYKEKYLEVTHYVSLVQHALNVSNIEPYKKSNGK